MAPEILKNQPYDQSCDMWSVGVILYVMLCGYTPFMEEHQERMFDRIKQGDWKFDPADWGHISQEAKDLISSMLETNVDARITAAQALKSNWINEEDNKLSSRDLSQSLLQLRARRPRLKDLARAFMALSALTKNVVEAVTPIQSEDGSSHQVL